MPDTLPNDQSSQPASSDTGVLQAGRPRRTALQVAALRAVHQLLDAPVVLDDPLALPILGAKRTAALRADPFQYNDPLRRMVRASLAVRSRLAEDELARARQRGAAQYVVLGAGLDTFAYRSPYGEALQVFEVDHPATQAWKREMLHDAGITLPPSLRFVPTDFSRDTLAATLAAADFRSDRPAFFSWLGVTVYLDSAAVLDTLRFVATLPPGSGIVFDYRLDAALMTPVETLVLGNMAQRVAEQGEPWKSAFAPAALAEQLRALGFRDLEDLGADELNARYLAQRKDGLRKGGGFRLMCAWR